FIGIYVNNASAPPLVNNNIVGSTGSGAALNSIRVLSSSTSTATTLAGITIGISVLSAVQADGNIVKNLSHQSATASGNITGITNTAKSPSVITITNNIITGNSLSATAGSLYGISSSGTPASITISNNIVSANGTAGNTTAMYGIYNTGIAPILAITNNLFLANTTTSSAGLFFAINNIAAVTGTINIDGNNIGNGSAGPIIFNAANNGAQILINSTTGSPTCALSISNNNFQGINYAVPGTGAMSFILNSAITRSQTINSNTFTNLNVQTSGAITFISNSVAVPGTGSQNINNNAISGTFTKRAAGTVTLMTSTATCASGSVININNNNFSNIILSAATIINGLVNTDAGFSTKSIQNNIFTNWTGGTGAITAMNININGTDNAITGNTINNITNAGNITGISIAGGNDFVYSNVVNTLASSALLAVVSGITVVTGTVINIYKNKIYDLQAGTVSGTVNVILVSAGTTVNIYNNIIGDLRTPAASAVDPVRGISITPAVPSTNINVYYNTIYMNASSTGINFGSSGIYHAFNSVAGSSRLSLINNSITNLSIFSGTGLVVGYRRNGTSLANYGPTSNYNLFYAGVPGANNLIFHDGTTGDQTLAGFKTRVASRDALSITEDISGKFLSNVGSSGVYLHMNESIPSQVESGGVNISGFTDDFDGQVRQGNPGYVGSGYAPDIGADEIFGIEDVPPAITYTLLTNTTSIANRTFPNVSITDASGVNITTGTKPRVYYKRLQDANVYADNTSSTSGWKFVETSGSASPFSFVIDYAKLYGGASVSSGTIQYFVVAQDLATSPNIAINSGTFAVVPLSVALTSAAFPIAGVINSYDIPFSGNYNVGVGNVFTSLTKAGGFFSAINAVGLVGNVSVTITSDLAEDGTTPLLQWVEQGAGTYTLTIIPDGTTVRTASGNAANGLIRLDGADRVTIDGSNSGSGSYLSFVNTNTAGAAGTALTFINGASNNTIRYCNFNAFASGVNGVVLFSTTTGAGNSNNLFQYNTIKGNNGTNYSNTDIYSAGTTGNENASNTISNNSIFNFRDRGLDISAAGSSAWNISNNSFYNGDISSLIDYSPASVVHAIRVQGGSGYTISNNFIGGNTAQASGADATYNSSTGNVSFYGIALTTSAAVPVSNIKSNTIRKIVINSVPLAAASVAFMGIETYGSGISVGGTSVGEGNLVGSNSLNGSITLNTLTTSTTYSSIIRGISFNSAGGSVTGNQVGGLDIKNLGTGPAGSEFTGINITNANAPAQVNNNIIGSAGTGAIVNSIRVRNSSGATNNLVTGISIGNSVATPVTLNNNILQNIAPRSPTGSGTFTGIENTATSSAAVLNITNNTIKNITTIVNNTNEISTFSGIISTSPSVITGNTIDNIDLEVNGANAQVTGINVSGGFVHNISSNTISNLISNSL
ncbi:MAG: hypothetical protein ABIN89_29895, partial [Chitinophagaceae bacterium]